MKTTVPLMLLGALLALSSCDLFVPPKVACDTITLMDACSLQASGKGKSCACDDSEWLVAHTPRVDEKWAAENGGSGNLSLAGMPVRVTSVSGRVCDTSEALDCLPTELQIDAHVDEMGLLTYRLWRPGYVLAEGEKTTISGTIAVEAYGPGNDCNVRFEIAASCAEFPEENNQ